MTIKLIRKLQRIPASLHYFLMSNDIEENLFQKFNALRVGQPCVNGNILLVQGVEDPFYFALFGQIACSLNARRPVRIEHYIFRSLNVGESISIWRFLKLRWLINSISNQKWQRLYGSFCDGVAYSSTSVQLIADLIDLYRAWKDWRILDNRENLIGYKLAGLNLGDLISDSYLRFKPAPTVDISDRYLLILIWQARRDFRRAEAYFSKNKPTVYLTSYSTYIQHGIAVRVAIKYGVDVYSFGNFQEFTKKLSNEDWYHTKNAQGYLSEFAKMDNQDQKIADAEKGLSMRISGGIDSATIYMRNSAYAESGDLVADVKDTVVVFLHDFYDSPHVYGDMVFADFWEWICFTIETLTLARIPFFVKPHPNQITLSEGVIKDLLQRYPDLAMIPQNVTNRQLVNAGIVCAVTVYGTVAHEMAYLGVPSITCAKHPHVSFDFCKTTTNKQEYAEALRESVRIGFDSDRNMMHRQALEFYYMHNLNLNNAEQVLRDWSVNFRYICAEEKEDDYAGKRKAKSIDECLNVISELDAFKDYIITWQGLLDSRELFKNKA
jgi:hypothetical protein